MLILGFHGGRKREDQDNKAGFELHDSAAVLIDDGEIVAAIEEERLSRIKHSNNFPARAIRYCLGQQRLHLRDVDFVATNFEESVVDFWSKLNFLDSSDVATMPNARAMISGMFERDLGVDVSDKLRFCKHHVAHAWSAYGLSGYDNSLILVLDGEGDNRSGMVLLGEGNNITKLTEFATDQSLGEFYTQVIKLLGYNRFDEYKVMGLAPYGNPNEYASLFERCYSLLPNGDYSLQDPITWFGCFENAGLLAHSRRKGQPFTQVHMDVAAGLQSALERIALHILEYYRRSTGMKNLCLAGGVAHNCTMNGQILDSGLFDQVFVQPAAHDAGGALGAALFVLNEEKPFARPKKLNHLFLGTDIGGDAAVGKMLSRWDPFITSEYTDNVTGKAAELIASGSVIGWVQGRSEFGPRALGHRSILADPRPAENKLLINQMVKKREDFRPFAPSVLEERVDAFFEMPKGRAALDYMIFILNVRTEFREKLGAITHVDGTARIQTVSKETDPRYWELISEFERLTEIPVLLNTSFNNNVEPIVDSVDEAVVCFLTTGIHRLVVGNYIVSKKQLDPESGAYRSLVPSLPVFRKLMKRQHLVQGSRSETVYEVETTTSRFFSQPVLEISTDAFSVLIGADGIKSLGELLSSCGITDDGRALKVTQEILDLWSKRAVILSPAKQGIENWVMKTLRKNN
ncbi:MAG: carbamoyltransferase family protein [Blastocatellia bacterium]